MTAGCRPLVAENTFPRPQGKPHPAGLKTRAPPRVLIHQKKNKHLHTRTIYYMYYIRVDEISLTFANMLSASV